MSTATLAQTQQDASAFLEEQLRCFSNSNSINPTPILLYFLHAGLIRLSDEGGGDSISCWNLRRTFVADGLPIKAICAFDANPLILAEYPSLYHRVPGTAGNSITIFTDAKSDIVEKWLQSELDGPHNSFHVMFPTEQTTYLPYSFTSGTKISCHDSSSGGLPQDRTPHPQSVQVPTLRLIQYYTCKDLVIAHFEQNTAKQREITDWMSLAFMNRHPELTSGQAVQIVFQASQIVGKWCGDHSGSQDQNTNLSTEMETAFRSLTQ